MPKTPQNCNICSKKLSSKIHLVKHMIAVHQMSKEFYCDSCDYKTDTKDKLRLHIFKHRQHFILICNVCGKEYKTNQSMRKHLRTHFQKHQCQHCGQIFSYKRLLVNHILAIHDEIQNIQCKCK